MNRKTTFLLSVILVMVSGSSIIFAGDLAGYKISGKIYFDYTHDISKDGPRTNGQDNGFEFRRAYLTINNKINDDFSVRFRTDADRKADDKMRPFLKHLYLQWKNLIPASSLYIGISGTPTMGVAEKVWGYRGLRKTVLDNFKSATGISASASSADVGLALKGSVMDKKVSYHAMLANGSHYSHPENDKYKKVYLSISANVDGFIIEGYFDHEAKSSDNINLTYKGFAGYQIDNLAIGTEYYMMSQGGNAADGSDLSLSALSLFGQYALSENSTAILRYDMYDPDADTDDTETGLIIAALDYRPAKTVSVIPNIFYYTNSGTNDNADIVGNLTFVWAFK